MEIEITYEELVDMVLGYIETGDKRIFDFQSEILKNMLMFGTSSVKINRVTEGKTNFRSIISRRQYSAEIKNYLDVISSIRRNEESKKN